MLRKVSDVLGHEPVAKIAIGSEIAGGNSNHARVSWQVHSVSNNCSGGIRHSRVAGQDRDCVGDAERKTATAPTAGCDAPCGLRRVQRGGAEK